MRCALAPKAATAFMPSMMRGMSTHGSSFQHPTRTFLAALLGEAVLLALMLAATVREGAAEGLGRPPFRRSFRSPLFESIAAASLASPSLPSTLSSSPTAPTPASSRPPTPPRPSSPSATKASENSSTSTAALSQPFMFVRAAARRNTPRRSPRRASCIATRT